jgi:hypothetical protein
MAGALTAAKTLVAVFSARVGLEVVKFHKIQKILLIG